MNKSFYFFSKNKKIFFILFIGLFISCYSFYISFYSKEEYHTKLDFKLSLAEIPVVNLVIDQSIYPVKIDLGSKFQLSLNKQVLHNIKHKKNVEEVSWKDFKGKKYVAPSFVLPNVHIGNLKLKNVLAKENNEKFEQNTTLWDDSSGQKEHVVGYIGTGLLKNYNILFDCTNSNLYLSNSFEKLQQDGFNLDNFLKVPFILSTKGIIIKIENFAFIKQILQISKTI